MLLSSVIPAVLGLLASTVCAADFPTLEIAGNKFFYSNNGSQFYIKGVAYQANTANTTSTSFVDPLADSDTCDRDIPYLAELGTNVVRVYAVNASLDHDHCMQKLQDHGIYVIADLSQPKESIISSDPSWDLTLFKRYTEVVDMFAKYDNVLGFFAGNEVVTQSNDTNSAPFIKAAIRDMKAYIADNYDRTIPVGYSANDDEDTRVFSADYFACGDEDESADFYGINMYEWCGKSSFATSGYKDRTEEFSNLTIPIFFSEYGCNAVQPRQFTEVQALYSDKMTDVWSGGIVYMYFQEENDYGLVSVSGDSVSTLSDFNNLKTQLASVSPTSATYSQVSATATAMSCPTANKMWRAVTDLPPTPDQGACDCLWDSLECIISDDVDEEDYGDLFGYVCSDMDCSGISKNGTTGDYGAFSFCSPKEMLSFVLNQYYEENGSKSSACDFSGSASVKSSSGASSCKSVLAAASTATGGATHVTKISGNTAGASSGSGSGSGSSSKSSSKSGSSSTSSSTASSAATPSMARPFLNLQDFGMIALFTTFFVGGVSYIFV